MDKGPWKVDVWCESEQSVALQSEDGTHEVALEISGDFEDMEQRKAYAEWLAGVLNRAAGNP